MNAESSNRVTLPYLNTESGQGLPLDALDGRLVRLHAFWKDRCADGRLPVRKAIDPLEFRFALGHVSLVDVVRGPTGLRFGIRLVGQDSDLNLRVRAREDRKPDFIDEIAQPEARSLITATYTRVVKEATASWARRDVILDLRRRIYDVVWLPFADDGHTVDLIMTGIVYHVPLR